mmetsp:Transcript_43517/g.117367  ORF Transcript_43517/g.117367 Transcript_43517/m.117367 type:complete len:239 (+) Transcript_43517:514-1230(+)
MPRAPFSKKAMEYRVPALNSMWKRPLWRKHAVRSLCSCPRCSTRKVSIAKSSSRLLIVAAMRRPCTLTRLCTPKSQHSSAAESGSLCQEGSWEFMLRRLAQPCRPCRHQIAVSPTTSTAETYSRLFHRLWTASSPGTAFLSLPRARSAAHAVRRPRRPSRAAGRQPAHTSQRRQGGEDLTGTWGARGGPPPSALTASWLDHAVAGRSGSARRAPEAAHRRHGAAAAMSAYAGPALAAL